MGSILLVLGLIGSGTYAQSGADERKKYFERFYTEEHFAEVVDGLIAARAFAIERPFASGQFPDEFDDGHSFRSVAGMKFFYTYQGSVCGEPHVSETAPLLALAPEQSVARSGS